MGRDGKGREGPGKAQNTWEFINSVNSILPLLTITARLLMAKLSSETQRGWWFTRNDIDINIKKHTRRREATLF